MRSSAGRVSSKQRAYRCWREKSRTSGRRLVATMSDDGKSCSDDDDRGKKLVKEPPPVSCPRQAVEPTDSSAHPPVVVSLVPSALPPLKRVALELVDATHE